MSEATKYYSAKVTDAASAWQEKVLVEDFNRAFKSIVVINDDDSLELQVRLNEMTNDIIYIPGGEGAALDKEVYRIFYAATSGSPDFRVMAD
jgi:hypothetical protein